MVLLVVLAHPDDESMGTGGLIARHTAAGVDVRLVCITRGGEGWHGKPDGATKDDLPTIRAKELEAAACELGIAGVELWDYPDGCLPSCDAAEISDRIAGVIRILRPTAVVGWGPDGAYGHPDHIVSGACTDAAVASIPEGDRPALYHIALDEPLAQALRDVAVLAGEEALPVVALPAVGPVFRLSPAEVEAKVRAIDCHASQLEEWRIEVKARPDLLERAYGREAYVLFGGGVADLGAGGLLAELA